MKTITEITQNKKVIYILDIIICFLFFNVQSISLVPLLDRMVDVGRLFLFLILAAHWLIFSRHIKLYEIFVALLFISKFAATFLNGDDLKSIFVTFFPIFTMILLIEANQQNLYLLINALYTTAAAIILVNTICMLLYPKGLYFIEEAGTVAWIIGQKQDWCTVYIPFFISSMLLWNEKKLRPATIAVYLMMAISFSMQLSLGLLLFFIVVPAALFVTSKIKCLNTTVMFVLSAIAEIFIIIIGYAFEKLTLLNVLLSRISANDVLTKRDTLMMRFDMWREGLGAFIHQPILGVGAISEGRWPTLIHFEEYHPNLHNTPIDILVTSGIIGLAAYIGIYVCAGKALMKSPSRAAWILTCGIFGINVLMLIEGVYAPFIWFFVFLAIYVERIDQNNLI